MASVFEPVVSESRVPPKSLAEDTDPDTERVQIERWRRMTPDEKAAIVSGLTRTVIDLARAGIQARHPDASERERTLRLAIITLGRELAQSVYPEIAHLERD